MKIQGAFEELLQPIEALVDVGHAGGERQADMVGEAEVVAGDEGYVSFFEDHGGKGDGFGGFLFPALSGLFRWAAMLGKQ